MARGSRKCRDCDSKLPPGTRSRVCDGCKQEVDRARWRRRYRETPGRKPYISLGRRGTPRERFDIKTVLDPNTGCILWLGSLTQGCSGYGQFGVDGRLWKAHRWNYEQLIGPIPEGMVLDHLCGVKHCVNPEHLEPVTQAENDARARRVAKEGQPRGLRAGA